MHKLGMAFMNMFTCILHNVKWYIKSFCYIFKNIVEDHLYAKFG